MLCCVYYMYNYLCTIELNVTFLHHAARFVTVPAVLKHWQNISTLRRTPLLISYNIL